MTRAAAGDRRRRGDPRAPHRGPAGRGIPVEPVRAASSALGACRATRPSTSPSPTCACRRWTASRSPRRSRRGSPALQVIVMTAFGSVETAVEAIRHGAFDYVSKPMNLDEIKSTVRRALAERTSTETPRRRRIRRSSTASVVVGRSPAMVEVYRTVARVAPSRSTVLIEGESGTGKELIAAALHRHSDRAGGRFVAVDCGSLTDTLLEIRALRLRARRLHRRRRREEGPLRGSERRHDLPRRDRRHRRRRCRPSCCASCRSTRSSASAARSGFTVDVRVVAATNRNLEQLVAARDASARTSSTG